MTRIWGRCARTSVSFGLVVVLAGWLTDSGAEGLAGQVDPATGRVTTVSQKQKTAKKKTRTKKGGTAANPDAATEAVTPATPKASDGSLKFSRDIAPILVGNCTGCHNAKQKRGKFDLSSFEMLMKGSDKEKVIVPGKPEESHLVLRIKGDETPKMPQGANRNLSEASIAKIEAWVKAGAILDAGVDPKAPLEKIAASPDDLRKGDLAKLSADQRDKQVIAVGMARWKVASPKTKPDVSPSAHFLAFGTLPKDRAAAAVKAVEGQYAHLKGLLGADAVDWGEKASLYIFSDNASFVEFVRAGENRDVEVGETATSRFNVAQPFVAVVDPLLGREEAAGASKKAARPKRGAEDEANLGGAERTLAGLLAEQFAIGATNRAGKPPRWVSLGLGAQVAGRVEKNSPYLNKIRRDAFQLWTQGWQSKANDALGDATKTEDVRVVGYALLEWLGSVNKAFPSAFIEGMMEGGEKLDDVIANVLNGSREQLLNASGDFVGAKYAR